MKYKRRLYTQLELTNDGFDIIAGNFDLGKDGRLVEARILKKSGRLWLSYGTDDQFIKPIRYLGDESGI